MSGWKPSNHASWPTEVTQLKRLQSGLPRLWEGDLLVVCSALNDDKIRHTRVTSELQTIICKLWKAHEDRRKVVCGRKKRQNDLLERETLYLQRIIRRLLYKLYWNGQPESGEATPPFPDMHGVEVLVDVPEAADVIARIDSKTGLCPDVPFTPKRPLDIDDFMAWSLEGMDIEERFKSAWDTISKYPKGKVTPELAEELAKEYTLLVEPLLKGNPRVMRGWLMEENDNLNSANILLGIYYGLKSVKERSEVEETRDTLAETIHLFHMWMDEITRGWLQIKDKKFVVIE
ncbi:hypothetical protein FRB99_006336 [Tulasnella sp. 403]|nr:hypothetical protein FRB99_006336 [Tulasnella sp. 403]